MFQVNDMVLYGTNGVCKVVDIDERDCGGRMVEYYILKPIYAANSTIFVPVNNEKLTSMMNGPGRNTLKTWSAGQTRLS